MVEIADIFRLHGPEYRSQFRDRMPPSHLRTMDAIEHCRTEALGGQLYFCEQCKERHYSYHSCKNRHRPKCQNDQAVSFRRTSRILVLIMCNVREAASEPFKQIEIGPRSP
jgi:Transposase zinc-binding domain